MKTLIYLTLILQSAYAINLKKAAFAAYSVIQLVTASKSTIPAAHCVEESTVDDIGRIIQESCNGDTTTEEIIISNVKIPSGMENEPFNIKHVSFTSIYKYDVKYIIVTVYVPESEVDLAEKRKYKRKVNGQTHLDLTMFSANFFAYDKLDDEEVPDIKLLTRSSLEHEKYLGCHVSKLASLDENKLSHYHYMFKVPEGKGNEEKFKELIRYVLENNKGLKIDPIKFTNDPNKEFEEELKTLSFEV